MDIQTPIQATAYRQQATEMILEGRMPHALLLAGREGGSAMMEALYTALGLMCHSFSEKGPCLECRNCKRINQWIHPDVHLMLPAFEPKPDIGGLLRQWRSFTESRDFFSLSDWARHHDTDRRPNLYGEQVRDLMHQYYLKSFEGEKKLFIIWGVELLDNQSNRILKILEEPTADTYFILVTYNKSALLPTILSRTQHFDIPRVPDNQMEQYALSLHAGEGEHIREAIYLADGNVAEMLESLRESKQEFSGLLLEAIRSAYSRNGVKMAGWTEEAAKMPNREFHYFIRYQLHFIREALRGFVRKDHEKRLLPNEQKAAEWLMEKANDQKLLEMVQKMDHHSRALNQYANTKILSMKIILDYKRLFYN